MSIQNILLAYDGSAGSNQALNWTLAFAEQQAAAIHIVTVVDLSGTISFAGCSPHSDDLTATKKSCLTQLNEATQAVCSNSSCPIHRKILLGNPTEQLLHYAQQEKMDMIVCGSHGLNNVAAILLGSVAHKLVTYATCPVMIVK